MSDIHNNFSGATLNFEAGSTQNGDITISGGTFNQTMSGEPTSTAESSDSKLTNRQLVLLMTSVLNLTLNPEFLNQKALARLLAAVSGKSEDSLRQTIMKMAKEGCETQGARQDMLVVASLLNDIDQDLAQRLRNDASE